MGSIRRSPRNASRWEARYRDPAGRQRTRTFDRRSDAQAFLKSVEADGLRGAYREPQLDNGPFETFANRWAEGLTRRPRPARATRRYWPITSSLRSVPGLS